MKRIALLLAAVFSLSFAALTSAQEESSLRLRLSRDFGTSFGPSIAGTFSMRISGPDDLVRVVFLIDGQQVAEDTEAPFRLQFKTSSYSPGLHTFEAVGYTAADKELRSNRLQRDFLSSSESSQSTIVIVVVLAVLVIGGRLLTNWIANRGTKRSGEKAFSGTMGGTICPNCGRPYSLHWWGINLLAGRFDRCPHCGKWLFVRRESHDALRAAAEQLKQAEAQPISSPAKSDEDKLRQQLDESRFDDTQ